MCRNLALTRKKHEALILDVQSTQRLSRQKVIHAKRVPTKATRTAMSNMDMHMVVEEIGALASRMVGMVPCSMGRMRHQGCRGHPCSVVTQECQALMDHTVNLRLAYLSCSHHLCTLCTILMHLDPMDLQVPQLPQALQDPQALQVVPFLVALPHRCLLVLEVPMARPDLMVLVGLMNPSLATGCLLQVASVMAHRHQLVELHHSLVMVRRPHIIGQHRQEVQLMVGVGHHLVGHKWLLMLAGRRVVLVVEAVVVALVVVCSHLLCAVPFLTELMVFSMRSDMSRLHLCSMADKHAWRPSTYAVQDWMMPGHTNCSKL